MTELRVLVVSLDRLACAGLASVLDQQPGLTVVGQVSGDEDSLDRKSTRLNSSH